MHPQAEAYSIQDTQTQLFVTLKGEGDPNQEIPTVMTRLGEIAGKSGLMAKMTGPPMGLYRRGGETMEWWMALPVAEGTSAPEGTETLTLDSMKAAYFTYTGSYDGLPDMWAGCDEKLKADGVAMATWAGEAYVDDPAEVPVEKLRTIIWIGVAS